MRKTELLNLNSSLDRSLHSISSPTKKEQEQMFYLDRRVQSSSSMRTSTSMQSLLKSSNIKKTSQRGSKVGQSNFHLQSSSKAISTILYATPQNKQILNLDKQIEAEDVTKNLQHLEMGIDSIKSPNPAIQKTTNYFLSKQQNRLANTLQCFQSKSTVELTNSVQSMNNYSLYSTHSRHRKVKKIKQEKFATEASEITASSEQKINKQHELSPNQQNQIIYRPQTAFVALQNQFNHSVSPSSFSSKFKSSIRADDRNFQFKNESPSAQNRVSVTNISNEFQHQSKEKRFLYSPTNSPAFKVNFSEEDEQSQRNQKERKQSAKFKKSTSMKINEKILKMNKELFDKKQHYQKGQGILFKFAVTDLHEIQNQIDGSNRESISKKDRGSLCATDKHMSLAATDYQYQKQIRQKEVEIKKNRFGQEIFNSFVSQIDRLRQIHRNKTQLEPVFACYHQSEDLCKNTLLAIEKCISYKKQRTPLENFLQTLAKHIELQKSFPIFQLFVSLQIAKILIDLNCPAFAIPILKFTKRSSFLNMQSSYLMKSYRSLSYCHTSLGNFEVALGYAAKYLHLSWTCNSPSNELNAYELLGKIFYNMGNIAKSHFYHNRMAENIRESDSSSLKQMQVENLKTIYKRRFEIIAAREVKKKRIKFDEKQEGSLCFVSSDDENDLNLLIPEQNNDILIEAEEAKAAMIDAEINEKKTGNKQNSNNQGNGQKKDAQVSLQHIQTSKDSERFSISTLCQMGFPIRKTPKFDIKADKGFFKISVEKANSNIGMEERKKEDMEKFLKKPIEYFLQFKNMNGIGPMRDRLILSHKSFQKHLLSYQLSLGSPKQKPLSLFNKDKQTSKEEIMAYSSQQENEQELNALQNGEQNEYWKETTVKKIDKSLHKIIQNIQFFETKREELRKQQIELAVQGKFFNIQLDPLESESDKLLKQIQKEKSERQGQYYLSQI